MQEVVVKRMCLVAGLIAVLAWTGPATAAGGASAIESVAASPVLGVRGLMGPYGRGWGAVKPGTIDNGGVPSGLVKRIRWKRWGRGNAYGGGITFIYRPGGGYYDRPGGIKLRATGLGTCNGRRTYTKLYARVVDRPGGRFGRRFLWSGLRSLCDPNSYASSSAGRRA